MKKKVKSISNSFFNETNSYCTPIGIDFLRNCLISLGWKRGTTFKLGYTPSDSNITSAKELDMISQVNYREFGGITDTLDDFFGAIFTAAMKVAVVGTASHDAHRSCDVFKVAGRRLNEFGMLHSRNTFPVFRAVRMMLASIGLHTFSSDSLGLRMRGPSSCAAP